MVVFAVAFICIVAIIGAIIFKKQTESVTATIIYIVYCIAILSALFAFLYFKDIV